MSPRPNFVIRVLAVLAPVVLAGGCADLMARSTIAPDWFQAKAVEVKGEGYPELADVPPTRPLPADWTQWKRDGDKLIAEAGAVDQQVEATGTPRTEAEIRASAAQLRALLGDDTPVTDDKPS